MALDPTLLIGLKALELYLDDMVIAGGWVPYLFAAHEQPSAEAVALKTRDLDIAVSRQVPEREKSIDQLLGEAGFTCEFRSLETPPVTAYVATHAGMRSRSSSSPTRRAPVRVCTACGADSQPR